MLACPTESISGRGLKGTKPWQQETADGHQVPWRAFQPSLCSFLRMEKQVLRTVILPHWSSQALRFRQERPSQVGYPQGVGNIYEERFWMNSSGLAFMRMCQKAEQTRGRQTDLGFSARCVLGQGVTSQVTPPPDLGCGDAT